MLYYWNRPRIESVQILLSTFGKQGQDIAVRSYRARASSPLSSIWERKKNRKRTESHWRNLQAEDNPRPSPISPVSLSSFAPLPSLSSQRTAYRHATTHTDKVLSTRNKKKSKNRRQIPKSTNPQGQPIDSLSLAKPPLLSPLLPSSQEHNSHSSKEFVVRFYLLRILLRISYSFSLGLRVWRIGIFSCSPCGNRAAALPNSMSVTGLARLKAVRLIVDSQTMLVRML